MKKMTFLFFCFLLTLFAYSQKKIKNSDHIKASPKEGITVFYQNFINEFKVENLPVDVAEVKFQLKFVIEKDGAFSEIQVINDLYNIGNEAKRVLLLMPAWNPALDKGIEVRSAFTLPIKLNLENNPDFDYQSYLISETEIKDFLTALNAFSVETKYFDFTCNCALAESSINDELKTEEFKLESFDDLVYYVISFRKNNLEDTDLFAKMKTISQQMKNVEEISFAGTEAIEISETPSDAIAGFSKTIFFNKNDYSILINILTEHEQLLELSLHHFKENFRLRL